MDQWGIKTMTNFKKIAVMGTAAVALVATPAFAAPVSNSNGKAKARVVKPLTLTIVGNDTLDFGTIVLPAAATGTSAVVSIQASSAGTVGTAGACGTDFVCSGAVASAINYNITGTQGQEVDVTLPATATITLVGGTDTLTVNLTTDLTDSDSDGFYDVALANSGAPGDDFYVGGSLTVADTTVEGNYEGSFTVTADYQ